MIPFVLHPASPPRRVVGRVALAALLLLALAVGAAQERPRYTLSVVPQFPRLVLYDDWQPLLTYLSETVGVDFELHIADTIPAFETEFLAGRPDFAFLNPYHEVMAMRAQGYLPLVSDGSRQLKGILVVRADSPVASVRELDGQAIAFPAPNAFGASLYMRALLAEQEGIAIEPVYVETHANAYRHTLLRRTAAGGGVMNTLVKEDDAFRAQLRVLYETPGVTPHPLAAHPRVPEAVREAVIEALLALAGSPEGRERLRRVQLTEPIRVDYDRDYRGLEELNLEAYVVIDDL